MPSFYLNSYAPLVSTPAGRQASLTHDLPPFIDGSIRREPDLEHAFPAISALCRGRMFAPRLQVGDVVAYSLRKQAYGTGRCHRRLTAVLRVIDVKPTHSAGAAWYRERELPLPNNCMVAGNKANPLSKSHRLIPKRDYGCAKPGCEPWDKSYKDRAKRWGSFVICEPLYIDLTWDAPEITDDIQLAVFGRIEPTLTPKQLPITMGRKFIDRMKLGIKL